MISVVSHEAGRESAGNTSSREYPGLADTTCAGRGDPWHRDPFHRVTVVLKGDLLAIEFRDGGETAQWKIIVGEVDWSEPSDRVHRAVNVGEEIFEGITTFFLDRDEAVPQPLEDSN